MSEHGPVRETYAAALQHDIADVPADGHTVGVVRRPTGWFRALVDENVPALGPPESLLESTKERQEELQQRGLCDEEAHNAAWEAVEFSSRYREYLGDDPEAERAIEDLVERAEAGDAVTLVCFEGDNKRCHRRILQTELESRLEGATDT